MGKSRGLEERDALRQCEIGFQDAPASAAATVALSFQIPTEAQLESRCESRALQESFRS